MNILNVSFNSISAKKEQAPKGKLGIKSNVSITSVEDANIGVDKSNTTLRVGFSFNTEYSPDYASIQITGQMIVLEEKENAKKMLDTWNKEKKVNKDFSIPLMNTIMSKCVMESIIIAKELNLPSPLPMPKVEQSAPVKAETKQAPIKKK